MRFIVCIILVFSTSYTFPDTKPALSNINTIVRAGYRNIGYVVDNDTLSISYCPLGYRDEYNAFMNLRNHIEQTIDTNTTTIEFQQSSWESPTVQILKARFEKRTLNPSLTFQRAFKLNSPLEYSHTKYNSKKYLLQFDIPLSMKFGDLLDPFIFKTGIRPDFRYTINPGILMYCQVDLYVHNEFDPHMWYKPANVGFAVIRPLSEKAISVTNVGSFTHRDIYGIDEEIKLYLWNDTVSCGLHGGIYGDVEFNMNTYRAQRLSKKMALAHVALSFWDYDYTLLVKGGLFLNGDTGAGIGLSRIFNEVEIGFVGIYSNHEFNGYIDVSIPLFPQHRKTVSSHGVGIVRQVRYSYRYDSKTVTYTPNDVLKGIEPEVGISVRALEGLANPVHFRHMERKYP